MRPRQCPKWCIHNILNLSSGGCTRRCGPGRSYASGGDKKDVSDVKDLSDNIQDGSRLMQEIPQELMCVCVFDYPSVECVQQGVSGPVGHTAAAMGLASLAELEALTPEGSLVDLAVLGTTEGHAKVLQLRESEGKPQVNLV